MADGRGGSRLAARAVVIGIAAYRHVRSLPIAVRTDARDMAALLVDPATAGYSPDAVALLTDGQATLGGLRAALSDAAAAASSSDEALLFYFSGHGHRREGGRSYLLASDSRLDDLDGTALADEELLAILRASPSRRQLLIIDSCHAGGVGALKSAGDARPDGVSEASLDRLASGSGRVVLASSREDETSLVLPDERNSVFTGSLLKGLRGGAVSRAGGMIGVFDLFDFVSADLTARAPDQHPVFKADALEQNFAVALAPSAGAELPPGGKVDVDGLTSVLAELYPLGPTDSEVWSRAGGDVSRLPLSGNGLARWHAALRLVARGGGGLKFASLIETVLRDFPLNADMLRLGRPCGAGALPEFRIGNRHDCAGPAMLCR